jgi:hypothetical protein
MMKSNKAPLPENFLGLGGRKQKQIKGTPLGRVTKEIRPGDDIQLTTPGFKPGKGPVKPANSIKNPGNLVGFGGIGNKEVNPMYRNTGIVLK